MEVGRPWPVLVALAASRELVGLEAELWVAQLVLVAPVVAE